jgi:hypothetical protein
MSTDLCVERLSLCDNSAWSKLGVKRKSDWLISTTTTGTITYPSPPMSRPPSPPQQPPASTSGDIATTSLNVPSTTTSTAPPLLPPFTSPTEPPPSSLDSASFPSATAYLPTFPSQTETSYGASQTGSIVQSGIAGQAAAAVATSASSSGPSSRTPRKSKAHVASACINCKRAHLSCDVQRPCGRCVASGKQVSCSAAFTVTYANGG